MNNSIIGKQSTAFNYQNKISSRHLIKAGVINDIYMLSLNDSLYQNQVLGYRSVRDFNGATDLIRSHFQHRFRLNENVTLVSGLYPRESMGGGTTCWTEL